MRGGITSCCSTGRTRCSCSTTEASTRRVYSATTSPRPPPPRVPAPRTRTSCSWLFSCPSWSQSASSSSSSSSSSRAKWASRPTRKANSYRHARHDTDWTVLSCLVWRCELSRPDSQTGAFCVRTASKCVRHSVSVGAVRPPDAFRRRTHLSGGQFTPPHQTRQGKTIAPASRPPPRRRPGRQLRLAARPPTRSDVVRHENVNTLWTAAYD